MTFEEWWESKVWNPIGCKDIAITAWNAAIQEAATAAERSDSYGPFTDEDGRFYCVYIPLWSRETISKAIRRLVTPRE